MEVTEMHRRAQHVFTDVLVRVDDDDLTKATPCAQWSVADLLTHVVDGNHHVAEMFDEVVPTPPVDAGRLGLHRAAADAAIAAFAAPDLASRTITLPFGEIPAVVFASIRAGDLYTHAWDLAVAIGADTDLDRELGEAVFAATAPVLTPELRGEGGPLAQQQPCSDDRPVADRMAAFLGRHLPPDDQA